MLLDKDNKENNSTLLKKVKLLQLKNKMVIVLFLEGLRVFLGKDEIVFKYKTGDYFGELALLKD